MTVKTKARSALVHKLAPVAPPCFETRSQWLMFLETAAEEQRSDTRHNAKVIVILRPQDELAFNVDFNYCLDCLADHRSRMLAAGKCHPDALRRATVDVALG